MPTFPGPLIGMVHLAALPGSPRASMRVEQIAKAAATEAKALEAAGFDAVLVENMHDLPYLRREVGPEIIAAMSACMLCVRAAVRVPVGVQILAGANRAAIAVANACGGAFIRAEGFHLASVADEGLMEEADAGPLLRFRRAIGAERVLVAADVMKKHSSHAITRDLDLHEHVKTAEFMGADAVIVTGSATGEPVDMGDLREVREATRRPVLVGSGADASSAPHLLEHADAIIVGSSIKRGGRWDRPVDAAAARAFVKAARKAR